MKKKIIYPTKLQRSWTLGILSFLFSLQSFSQSPPWLWAKSAGGTAEDYGNSCTTDASGNIIATGYFQSPTITFGTTVLTNAGGYDMFIVKYNPGGNVLWAKSAGGTDWDQGISCSTDAGGNIIATGRFGSPTITFGTTVLTNAGSGGYYDMFIVKYDSGGNVLWAKSAGGTSSDLGYSCTTDAGGNIIAAGSFQSPTITFGTTVLTNAGSGYTDMFIVKYDGSGNVLWAKSAGETDWDQGISCSTDAGGNIIATGYFQSPTITFGTTVLTNAGNEDMFIVKYDSGGNVLWAKSAGGTSADLGYSCSTDAGGNIIAAGWFQSPTITFGTTVLTNAGLSDIFIVKYAPGGNVLWAKSEGGTAIDYGVSCSTDAGGNIIAAGSFDSPTITFGTTVLTNAGGYDMFIVKYNPGGNVLWAKSTGGTNNDYGSSCTTDTGGNIIATGYFYSSTITFGTTVLTNAGPGDMFIAKLDTLSIPTGNNDASASLSMTGVFVFPNPAGNELRIQSRVLGTEWRIESVEIFDVLGEKCLTPTLPRNTGQVSKGEGVRIDVSSLAKGIYFVTVTYDAGTKAVKKFVKM